MRLIYKLSIIITVIIIISTGFNPPTFAQQAYVSYQVFYDQLSPYGQWVTNPDYGYVWIPNTGPDFIPYESAGYWVLTDYGWTWVSNYSWGWAAFHYGRWGYDNYYGWYWVPGNEWGPAWVIWRRAYDYYGWAPMQPGMTVSISFDMDYRYNEGYWVFVNDRYIDSRDINRYYVNRYDRSRLMMGSTVIQNTYIDNRRHYTYVSGPGRADVQRAIGRSVNPVSVREIDRPGQQYGNNGLEIYRPDVNNNTNYNQGRRSEPSRVYNQNDVRSSRGGNAPNNGNSNPYQYNYLQPRPIPANQENNNNNMRQSPRSGRDNSSGGNNNIQRGTGNYPNSRSGSSQPQTTPASNDRRGQPANPNNQPQPRQRDGH